MHKSVSFLIALFFIPLLFTTAKAQEKKAWGQVEVFQVEQAPEIKNFHVILQQEKIYLNWIAPQIETETTYFIERSTDKLNFIHVGFKHGIVSPVETLYSWIDADPLKGTVHYRIKKIASDGNTSISKVISMVTDLNSMANNEERKVSK